ncbi:MAG: PilT/PilU family type 4a pilus ATPase [Actinobacteria bacterium]|nr:PilT/PilU family type 4a pilus ATPase [Actinomycetota bacterium]
MAQLSHLLHFLVEQRGSDLIVKVGSVPHVRRDGRLHATSISAMGPAEIEALVAELIPIEKAEELAERGEADIAHSVSGVGRFRVNVYRQRGSLGMAIRRVLPGAPSIADLNLPPVVERIASEEHGLILVTGPASSGKTTTVSGIVDHINASRSAHIVTLEDPIEVLHSDKQSMVSQRELGSDAADLATSLRRVGRQDADVVYVTEVNDPAVAAAALHEAAAGRLVISTMTTLTAAQSVTRFVEFFPPHQQRQARRELGAVLRGVVTQRLLDRADGRGRIPAVEVLVGTQKVMDTLIAGTDEEALEQLITEGEYHGMQSFDQALFQLYKQNLIAVREALAAASRPEDLRITLGQAGYSAAH